MGRSRQQRLDRLIEEVSRGQRELDSIREDDLREAVRIALRIHRDIPSVPDALARIRMRALIMGRLRPRRATLADHAWTALDLLARPAPYIVRSIAISSLIVAVGMSATVASADSLPDDALYSVKLTSETVRLALAAAPMDRASVELSIAEHRLDEAERLATTGRAEDALVASAMYTQHVASAAAELAPADDSSTAAQQLETTFTSQRERAQALSVTLAGDTRSAAAAAVLATLASSSLAPGPNTIQRVADTAANVADQLANTAEADATRVRGGTPTPAPEQRGSGSSRATQTPRATRANETARPTTEAERHANDIAKVVRKAANDAKAAAERTKHRR